MRAWTVPLLMLAAACTGEVPFPGETGTTGDDTGIAGDDTGDDPVGYPSSYDEGQYKITSLSINGEDDGIDVTGDGTPENNLPNALKLIDLAMPDFNLSRENLNALLGDSLLSGGLVYLIAAKHHQGELITDWLPGELDFNNQPAPSSDAYDSSGFPKYRLRGVFTDERPFEVGPGEIELSIIFLPPPEPPVPIAIELAVVEGDLDATGTSGIIGGAIPSDRLIEDAIRPLIPEEGVDTNGDGQIDLTKEQIMNTVTALAENENVSDVDLGGGRRGVSCALSYTALPTEW